MQQQLTVRDRKHSLTAMPRHWHGGRCSVSRFFDNLSVFFPEGERFFMRSLRMHRLEVSPERRDAIRVFCAQEGLHGREHRRYNEALREHGYPVEELEARVKRILAVVQKTAPPRWQLAVTCALEHFTALMGHVILENPKLLEGADPEMARLWRWHAAEEAEHKAVAFDVYLEAGGGYAERSVVMLAATLIFWALVVEHQARFMARDGDALDPAAWGALLAFLFQPGGLGKVWRLWAKWFRPGFHPDDIDSDALLAAWAAEAA